MIRIGLVDQLQTVAKMNAVPHDTLILSHACAWDATGRLEVRAFCGAFIKRTDHRDAPSCPRCEAVLRYLATASL